MGFLDEVDLCFPASPFLYTSCLGRPLWRFRANKEGPDISRLISCDLLIYVLCVKQWLGPSLLYMALELSLLLQLLGLVYDFRPTMKGSSFQELISFHLLTYSCFLTPYIHLPRLQRLQAVNQLPQLHNIKSLKQINASLWFPLSSLTLTDTEEQ